MRARALGPVGFVFALFVALAAARGEDLRTSARQHFERGRAAFVSADYLTALVEFQASYGLAPFPALLYNIARCHEELHHTQDALEGYQRYLAVLPPGAEHDRLAAHIAALQHPRASRVADGIGAGAVANAAQGGLDLRVRADERDAIPPPPSADDLPLYRRWWLWAAAGAVAVLAIGIGVGVAASSGSPSLDFPALVVPR